MKTLLSGRRFAPPARVCAVLAGLAVMAASVNAKTVNVDGTNFTTLSAAVADAYSDTDPAIVNLMVNSLPAGDLQVVLDKPITINGDGNADTIQCDLLVDVTGIKALTNANTATPNDKNAYITVATAGTVEINNLKIHPNVDGNFTRGGTERQLDLISGIRLMRPANALDVGTYNLTKVYVSGSDSTNAYVPLDTNADLFNQSEIKRWGGHNGNNSAGDPLTAVQADGQYGDDSAIQLGNGGGLGVYNATLDHCHAGLSRSAALNIAIDDGTQKILGGVFGHSARDGIRIEGTGVTVEGTANDRVRVVNTTNLSGDLSQGVEVAAGGQCVLMRYVDVASINSANLFNIRSGELVLMEYCRALGKFNDVGTNQAVFIDGASTLIGSIQNCTFHGSGSNPVPFNVQTVFVDPFDVVNCIFTSHNSGTVNPGSSVVTFTNCALPNDGVTSETLAVTPVTPTAFDVTAAVSASPLYQERLVDYDWSDAQGGDGNADVLRPSNSVAYAAAGTGGTPLVGGAGGTEVPVSLSGFTIE